MESLNFLWLDGIRGDSRDPRHIGEFDVINYSFFPSGDSSQPGQSSFSPIRKLDGQISLIVKIPPQAVSGLWDLSARGKKIAIAIFTIEKNLGGQSGGHLLRCVMRDTYISGINVNYDKEYNQDNWTVILSYKSFDLS